MDWDRDLPTWPLHALSRRVFSRPHIWHVQETGAGPLLLLLHGAGGSTHSWRDLVPSLAAHHRVVAIDLPGQGFTRPGTRQRMGLDAMAEDIARLALAEGWQPEAIIGHSAGGAIALNLAGVLRTPGGRVPKVVGINAAIAPFDGRERWLFPALAKLLVLTPLVPRLFALTSGNPARVGKLIEGTGSHLNAEGLALYTRLIADRDHVDATLRMMAQWSLDRLLATLPAHPGEVLLLAGDRDRAVPPETADAAAARMRRAHVRHLPGLGHLAHEEDPALLVRLLAEAVAG